MYPLLVLLLLASGSATAQRRDVRLMPGDAVHIYVYDGLFPTEKSKFISLFHDKEFILNGKGEIVLGPVGRVSIAGLKAEEVSEVLQEKFKPYSREPFVIVVPLVRLSLKGGFGMEGLYRFDPNMSFWEMIKEVGGLISLSSFEDMYIVREKEVIYRNFGDAFYKGQSLYELGLESGDEIIAPRVNRLTFSTIIRYIQFGMSIMIFYFTLMNYNTKR